MAYDHVNGAWPCPRHQLPPLTAGEAVRAGKALYRLGMGKAWEGTIHVASGNRYSGWIRISRKRQRVEMVVNPDQGWWSLIHGLSHYVHHKKNPHRRPHDWRHEYYEKMMIEHVVKNGWLEGKLKETEKPKIPLKNKRAERVAAKLRRWEAKKKRAENAIRKAKRQVAYYEAIT